MIPAQTSTPDLTLSIISADNLDQLLPCLESVFANTHTVTLEVYVVDNAAQDGTAAAVAARFPQVNVIQNRERQGFSTNNNRVLARGRGRYLMLLNDDTLVLDAALDRLVAFADTTPDAGVVGAWLLNPDRTFQPAFSFFPNPWFEAFWSSSAFFPRLRASAQTPFTTDTVSGAALMIRRDTYEEIGGLDTRFDPIYAEETDWCYRVRAAGWRVYTHPQATIVHYGSQTMNRMPLRKLELLQGHKAEFFRKHYGPVPTLAFKLGLCLASAAKFLVYRLLAPILSSTEKSELHGAMCRIALRL